MIANLLTLFFTSLGIFINYKAFGQGSMEWIITAWVLMGISIGTMFTSTKGLADITVGQILISMVGMVVNFNIIFSSDFPTHVAYGIFYFILTIVCFCRIWHGITNH